MVKDDGGTMRRARPFVAGAMLAAGVLSLLPTASDAWSGGGHGHFGHGHFRRHAVVRSHVFVGLGPAFWWGPPYPYWWYGPPAYVGPVVAETPSVYVQQGAPTAAPTSYWYYCASAKSYYPSVPTCPEAWIPVPASR
jgi:hypothetical protein